MRELVIRALRRSGKHTITQSRRYLVQKSTNIPHKLDNLSPWLHYLPKSFVHIALNDMKWIY